MKHPPLSRPLQTLLALTLAAGVVAASCGMALAQGGEYDCYVVPDTASFFSNIETPPAAMPAPNIRDAVLRLRVHVIRDSNGNDGWSVAQVDSQIARLRADFAPRRIYFQLVGVDDLYSDYEDTLNYWTQVLVLQNELNPDPTAINVVLGTAVASAVRPFGVTLADKLPAYRCLVGVTSSHSTSVLSHEVGHCLGLYHTFDSANACTDNPWENPEDCAVCGDLVCDTNWDPHNGSQGLGHLWDHTDPATCEYDSSYSGAHPDPTNIMAYTHPVCMEGFTPGQADRMLAMIETASLLQNKQEKVGVEYENRSGDTDLVYDGTPYSSTILDYNNDNKKDLFVAMRDDFGSLQQQYQLSYSQVPQFTDRTANDFDAGDEPQEGLRGVVAADYDNDGHTDLFAAADSVPRLYHNNNGVLSDAALTLGVAALADSSYAGAWGDFDRDGQIDLYVCRGAGGGSDPTAANLNAVRGRLLRNDLRASGSFVDSSDKLGTVANAMGASVAASWADVDDDGDLDLFVGDLRDAGGSVSSRLYVNNGAGSLTESFASRFSSLTIENVNSVVWGDVNIDGKLDLVLGGESAPPTVYFNNGAGEFDAVDPLAASLDAPTNDVRSVDTDLDGLLDLVAVPRESSDHRWLFWSQMIEDEQKLLDQSYWAGLADSTGRIDGLAMADFNGDGDTDVYFGRPVDTDDVFYRAKGAAADSLGADWVGVKLVAGGGNNGSAIGARVRFYIGASGSPSYQQMQIVDGGSGKGGQADNVLICGLGDRSGTVSAEVKWPGGYSQTATLTRRAVTTIADATVPGQPDSVSAVYTALPEGQAEFTFTWDTPYSCKPSLDKVTLTLAPRQPSACSMGTVVLTPSTDNVEHSVAAKSNQDGGGYRHSLTWPLECRAPCAYSFTIESATDATHKNTATGQISMPVCISQ